MALMNRETVSRFTAIKQVEATIDRILSEYPRDVTSTLSPSEVHFFGQSVDLRRLLVMKELYRLSEDVDRVYTEHNEQNRAARNDNPSSLHLEAYERSFKEINEMAGRPFGRGQVRRFLDLGFAPGGVTTWLLRSNGSALGTGISLSLEASGIQSQVDLQFLARFQQRYEDIRDIADGRATIDDGAFDLVIANAAVVLPEDNVSWNHRVHLVYAQLLVAFQNIAPGGSLTISLQTRPFDWVVDVLTTLRQSFASIIAVKPKLHAKRSVTHVVCQGYMASSDAECSYVERIRAGIGYLKQASGAVDAPLGGTANLPRISAPPNQVNLEAQVQFVAELLTPVWKRQYTAIHEHYQEVLRDTHERGPTVPASNADAVGSWRRQQTAVVQPGGSGSSNWRNRATEQHGSGQRGREHRTTGSGDRSGRSGGMTTDLSWRRGQH